MTVEESPGKLRTIKIPGFLVDSTIIHGSSGSPVVFKPVRGLRITDGTNYAQVMPQRNPDLLGIVSSTKLTAIKVGKDKDGKDIYFPALAGLGVVYDAATIRETIELFFVK